MLTFLVFLSLFTKLTPSLLSGGVPTGSCVPPPCTSLTRSVYSIFTDHFMNIHAFILALIINSSWNSLPYSFSFSKPYLPDILQKVYHIHLLPIAHIGNYSVFLKSFSIHSVFLTRLQVT